MSNVQHAAAPWTAKPVDDDNLIRIKNAEGGQVAICSNFSFFDTPETLPGKELVNEANARRIVACVNACEGFATEVLEGANLLESAYAAEGREFDLTKQRDALLAALESIYETLSELSICGDVGRVVDDEVEVARAAIAAVKPQFSISSTEGTGEPSDRLVTVEISGPADGKGGA